jgi:hypothetical protein
MPSRGTVYGRAAVARGVATVPRPRTVPADPTRALPVRGTAIVRATASAAVPAPVGQAARAARIITAGPLLAGALAAALWISSVLVADAARMGSIGLVSVLPWWYFVGLVLLVGALGWELLRPRPVVMYTLTLLLIGYLFGTASAVEPIARLPVAWFHAGLTEWIAVNGRALPPVDARSSWPGMFSLSALVTQIMGVDHASDLLRWAPPVFEALYLAPLRVIAEALHVGKRAGWIGTLIFYLGNWIDQDYFSPQALNILFYLVVLAAVLAFWQPPLLRPRAPLFRRPAAGWTSAARAWWRQRFAARGLLTTPRRQVGLLAVLVLVLFASVASHQITPFGLVIALGACFIARRLPGPELPIALAVLILGWLSFAASDFWTGHLDLVFGGFGQVFSSVQENVADRLVGAPAHEFIVRLRVMLTGAVIVLAGFGVLRRWRRQGRIVELLAAAPFCLVAVQSYGGEGLMRAALFALPFTGLLAGVAVAPLFEQAAHKPLRRYVAASTATALLAVLALWLALVRGGNDPYVSFTQADRTAFLEVAALARPGQTVALYAPYVPAQDQDLGRIRVVSADPDENLPLDGAVERLLQTRPDYLLLTESQRRWGELVRDWAPHWQSTVEQRFLAAGYQRLPAPPSATVMRAPELPVRPPG